MTGNVLITCAGRRNYLVQYFRQALAGSGIVVCADLDSTAPALIEADVAVTVPPVASAGYVENLIALCQEFDITLVVSLNDYELPVLAEHRDAFLEVGSHPAVSSPDVIGICLDKWRTYSWLTGHDIACPATFLNPEGATDALRAGRLSYPVVLKPRWGTGSLGISVAEDQEELRVLHALSRRSYRALPSPPVVAACDSEVLIQQRVQGEEYGLDVVNDLQGRYRCTLVKRKLGMRAGETDRAVTVVDPGLEILGERIGTSLGHVGNLDCDVFLCESGAYVLEMNPRFGGGYPFSHVAGANVPAALVAWASDREADPEWLRVRPGVVAAKYSALSAGRANVVDRSKQ